MAETPKRADRQEIARRVERGEKLLQKGKPAEALEEFLQILSLDSGNDTVRQMASDLCLSLQRLPEAVRLLGELFEECLPSRVVLLTGDLPCQVRGVPEGLDLRQQ